jgi:NADH-quinone oxidoreductase subunit M
MIFGQLTKDSLKGILDLKWQEAVILVPLVVLIILFGFYPAPILRTTAASSQAVVALYRDAVGPQVPIVKAAPAAPAAAPAANSQ